MKFQLLLLPALALGLVGCLGGPATQADDREGDVLSPQPDGVGAQCAGSAQCASDLRCLRLEDGQYCVATCTGDAQCASNLCNAVAGSEVGWCEFAQVDPGVGDSCVATEDCSDDLRCLALDQARVCVSTCGSHADCPSGVCNPVDGSSIGWCEYRGIDPGPDPDPDPGNNGQGPGNNGQDPDPDPDPGNNGQDPGPDPDPEPQLSASGLECDCDSNCADVGGQSGICVQGICMVQASGSCASGGSRGECPGGFRCWNGTGVNVCYPDCGANACEGSCDGDNSCVRRNGQGCYQSCGTLCEQPGNPPDGGPPGGGPDPDPDPDPGPEGACGTDVETRQMELMNADRRSNGLPALACHTGIGLVAREHSEDMARRGFFSHSNPEGQQPWDRVREAGIDGWRSVGENIAYGYPTPEAVETTWMNSPGHRANILNSGYTHIGVGAYNDNGTWYWTQVFATF
jgi:hypothetical protein